MKSFTKYSVVVVLYFMICSILAAKSNPIRVVYIRPSDEANQFWNITAELVKKAAKDLNIDLKVFTSSQYIRQDSRSRMGFPLAIDSALKLNPIPNYIITLNVKNFTYNMMKKAESLGIKTFLINTDIPQKERSKFGYPREKLKNWIGHISPDDEQAGYLLARSLIKEARSKKTDQLLKIVAISGGLDSTAALKRIIGLERAVAESPGTNSLLQSFFTDWDPKNARKISKRLRKRFGAIDIVWTASDAMALAVAEEIGNNDLVIGGIDGIPEALEAINKRKLTVSITGHFMEAVWALIMIYDYHHNKDFCELVGTQIKKPANLVDKRNVNSYLSLFDKLMNLDYSKFSRKENPAVNSYYIGLEEMINRSEQSPWTK